MFSADTSRARTAFQSAEVEYNKVKRDMEKAEKDAQDLFDVTRYGKDGEWKKLDGTCLEKDTGE